MGWEAFDGETWFPVRDVRVKREVFGMDMGTYSVGIQFVESNAVPDNTLLTMRPRREDESDEAWMRSMRMITNVGTEENDVSPDECGRRP
jgi:hypothetical protein